MPFTIAFLGDLGGGELLIIALLALVMFGSKRLPEFGRAFGRAMREFKRATRDVEENLREVLREDPLGPALRQDSRQISRGRRATVPSATAAAPAVSAAGSETTGASTATPAPSANEHDHSAPSDSESASPDAPRPAEKNPPAEDEIAG